MKIQLIMKLKSTAEEEEQTEIKLNLIEGLEKADEK